MEHVTSIQMMATGGKVPGRLPGSAGSEHLSQRICQPCLEKDTLVDATGLCVDCQDYLCLMCYDDHKEQQHRVLDREQMLHGQTQAKPEDACSDSCPVHENEVIQYYCASHCHLGCKSCIHLDHAACDEVHYIPHLSKELVNNEDYRQVETQLKSVLDTFINVFRKAQRDYDEIGKSCVDALRELKDFRRQIHEVLGNIECEFEENVKTLRLNAERELAEIRNKYKAAYEELQYSLTKIEILQDASQNCSSYIEMMRTKSKIKSLEDKAQQAEADMSNRQGPIQFYPNEELLELLKNPGGFGTISSAGTRNVLSGSDEVPKLPDTDTGSVSSWGDDFSVISDTESMISQHALRTETLFHGSDTGGILSGSDEMPKLPYTDIESVSSWGSEFSVISDTKSMISQHALRTETLFHGPDTGDFLSCSAFGTQEYQLNVKTERDNCRITGMVVLPDSRLVLTDYRRGSIKVVDVHTSHVVAELRLKSRPWNVTFIEKNKIAVTVPCEKQIAFCTFGDVNLRVRSRLAVDGECFGVDYRNGKLAVSFIDLHKVQILNLKGRVLHSITRNKLEAEIFDNPCYLTFGQDDTVLYVSNFNGNNLVCVKVDGTVMATYRDRDLQNPGKAVVDSSGNVYVCANGSNTVHDITKYCRKLRLLLTHADGLDRPCSICLSEEEDKLYVGMDGSYNVNVYRTGYFL